MAVTPVSFSDPRWEPLNPSAQLEYKISEDGKQLAFSTRGGTDWWRTPEVNATSGPVLGFWRKIEEGFEVGVEVGLDPKVQVNSRGVNGCGRIFSAGG
jgi:hypothetical protein